MASNSPDVVVWLFNLESSDVCFDSEPPMYVCKALYGYLQYNILSGNDQEILYLLLNYIYIMTLLNSLSSLTMSRTAGQSSVNEKASEVNKLNCFLALN